MGGVRTVSPIFGDHFPFGVRCVIDFDRPITEFSVSHSTLNRTKVNTYGLVYEWGAAEASSAKPILLAAHQGLYYGVLSDLNVIHFVLKMSFPWKIRRLADGRTRLTLASMTVSSEPESEPR